MSSVSSTGSCKRNNVEFTLIMNYLVQEKEENRRKKKQIEKKENKKRRQIE